MGAKLARLGDSTVGLCSIEDATVGGSIVGASGNVFANGIGVARVGDPTLDVFGHPSTITGGRGDVIVNGSSAAKIGSPHSGVYVGSVTSASPNVG